jgi:hypothetical protein
LGLGLDRDSKPSEASIGSASSMYALELLLTMQDFFSQAR